MAARQGVQVQTPLKMPMWVSLTWGISFFCFLFCFFGPGVSLEVHQSGPNAGPEPFICTASMEVGLKLLKLPSVGPQYPSGMSFSQAT